MTTTPRLVAGRDLVADQHGSGDRPALRRLRTADALARFIVACLTCAPTVALAQRPGSGSSGHGDPDASLGWVLVVVIVLLGVVAWVTRSRGQASEAAQASQGPERSTLALRIVAGTLTWLGALVAIAGLVVGLGTIAVGVAAEQGVLGLLGGALPALGGGIFGTVIMAMGQLLGCIAAIEAHARAIAKQTAANTEETARLRAVLRARLPPPPMADDEVERLPTPGAARDAERATGA